MGSGPAKDCETEKTVPPFGILFGHFVLSYVVGPVFVAGGIA